MPHSSSSTALLVAKQQKIASLTPYSPLSSFLGLFNCHLTPGTPVDESADAALSRTHVPISSRKGSWYRRSVRVVSASAEATSTAATVAISMLVFRLKCAENFKHTRHVPGMVEDHHSHHPWEAHSPLQIHRVGLRDLFRRVHHLGL